MNYIVIAFEIQDYAYNQAADFILDYELINGISDVVYGYIDNPSEFNKIPLSNLSGTKNSKLIFYAPLNEQSPSFASYNENAKPILVDLERPFDLMVIDESNLKALVIDNAIDFHYDLLTQKASHLEHFE
jgi:hypothetical protein